MVNDRRDARGAAGHVDTHNAFHGHGEVLARIRVPQIVFRGKRQALQVKQAFNVVPGKNARLFKFVFIEFRVERPVNGFPQKHKLHSLKECPVHGFGGFVQKRNLHGLIFPVFPMP